MNKVRLKTYRCLLKHAGGNPQQSVDARPIFIGPSILVGNQDLVSGGIFWDSGILVPGDDSKHSVGSQRILVLSRVLGEWFSGANKLS